MMKDVRPHRQNRHSRNKGHDAGIVSKKSQYTFALEENISDQSFYILRLSWNDESLDWIIPNNLSMNPNQRMKAYLYSQSKQYFISQDQGVKNRKIVLDRGKWNTDSVDIFEDVEKGNLKITFEGKKIFGDFHFIRSFSNSSQWNIGRIDDFDPWPGQINIKKIIKTKQVPLDDVYIQELKYDGLRLLTQYNSGEVRLWSISSKELSARLPHITQDLLGLSFETLILDGYLVSYDENGHSQSRILLENLKQHRFELIRYVVTDVLYIDGKDLRQLPLFERKTILDGLNLGKYIDIAPYFFENSQGFKEAALSLALDGVVFKNFCSGYTDKEFDQWREIEFIEIDKYELLSVVISKNKLKSIVLRIHDNIFLETYHVIVPQELRDEFLVQMRKSFPFNKDLIDLKTGQYPLPPKLGLEIGIYQTSETQFGILKFKRFLYFGKNRNSIQLKHSSNKIVFRVDAISKLDLLNFYEDFLPIISPHFLNIPLQNLRCPKGTEQFCFIQKNWPDYRISGLKNRDHHFYVYRAKSILSVLNLNAIEFRTNSSSLHNPNMAREIVLNFHPREKMTWKLFIQILEKVRLELDELGIKSYPKLTGGRGIHIHIPLFSNQHWTQVESFIEEFKLRLLKTHPKDFCSDNSQLSDGHKLSLEHYSFRRNEFYIAPYSLKAGRLFSLSLPMSWSDVLLLEGPISYNLAEIRKMIYSRSIDPWEDYYQCFQLI